MKKVLILHFTFSFRQGEAARPLARLRRALYPRDGRRLAFLSLQDVRGAILVPGPHPLARCRRGATGRGWGVGLMPDAWRLAPGASSVQSVPRSRGQPLAQVLPKEVKRALPGQPGVLGAILGAVLLEEPVTALRVDVEGHVAAGGAHGGLHLPRVLD